MKWEVEREEVKWKRRSKCTNIFLSVKRWVDSAGICENVRL
jgi:hypothetical protein